MDLVADMLLDLLQSEPCERVAAAEIRPAMRRRATRLKGGPKFSPAAGRIERMLFNADRLANRFWDYPRYLTRRRDAYDVFHIVDHSYAQLVHVLPANRTIVTCHDMEAFRFVVDPANGPRSRIHRMMAERMLSGFRKAARIVCVSEAVRDEVLAYNLVSSHRLTVIPNGVHPACRPQPHVAADAEVERLLGPASSGVIDLLHVGSTIPRKRIDVLLQVFAVVRIRFPEARLIRVGGAFTPAQAKLANEIGVSDRVLVLPRLERDVLAAVYRRAALVLQPSAAEGFGLPVAEAMACGAQVIASDLPVLREVGGRATTYCPVGDVPAWSETVARLLLERQQKPTTWEHRRASSIGFVKRFSWQENARKTVALYHDVAQAV